METNNYNINEELHGEKTKENNNNIIKSNKSYSKLLNSLQNKNINNQFEKKLREEKNIYYVPICREEGCNGNLKISIDETKFLVNYICENNENHVYFNNLFFETFERCYLKEKIIYACFNCSKSIENSEKYKCLECDNYYCSSCFLLDRHIQKNFKNLTNLNIGKNKCPKDQSEIIYYSINCNQKICFFCFKRNKEDNPHKNHNIINILDKIPTNDEINNLKDKILKKSNAFDSFIKSLDKWQNTLNKKIERIKQKLRSEIRILNKLFFNFNINYIDYTYYSNFHSFLHCLKDYDNEYLKGFMESKSFEDKTKFIFNLITLEEPKSGIEEIKFSPKKLLDLDAEILENFTDDLLLHKESNFHFEHGIQLIKYYKNKDSFLIINQINFKENIHSLNFSPDKKKIYVCLEDKKAIKIINYNPIKNNLKLSEENIETNSNGHFKKCIHINNNSLIAIDNLILYIWIKDDINSNKYTNIEKIKFKEEIYDICKINDDNLIISQKSKITFLNLKNLSERKNIKKIDSTSENNNLILIKDYILVNCEKGIAIISLKTKEMIQYIEWDKKSALKLFKDYIYIFGKDNIIYKFYVFENNLKLLSKIIINKKNFSAYNIYVNNEETFIWGNSLFRLIKDEN